MPPFAAGPPAVVDDTNTGGTGAAISQPSYRWPARLLGKHSFTRRLGQPLPNLVAVLFGVALGLFVGSLIGGLIGVISDLVVGILVNIWIAWRVYSHVVE